VESNDRASVARTTTHLISHFREHDLWGIRAIGKILPAETCTTQVVPRSRRDRAHAGARVAASRIRVYRRTDSYLEARRDKDYQDVVKFWPPP
jgi:hypothetical protein